ncbi:MAG: hypothetical protein KBC72_08160 [Acinetobacter sp.]|nr:hypothetical protein [Acinetobacter sp.]
MSKRPNFSPNTDQTIYVVLACEPCAEADAHLQNFGMNFIFSEMQLAQNIDDAYSMAKVMANKNPNAKMHSILAMTPDEIDAMVERVQGSAF